MALLGWIFGRLIDGYASLWPVLVESLLRGLPLILLSGALLVSFRRASAAFRHQVLFVAMAGLLLMPVVGVVLPDLGVPVPLPSLEIPGLATDSPVANVAVAGPEGDTSSTEQVAASTTAFELPWRAIAASLWIFVSLAIIVRLLGGHVRAWRLVGRATPALCRDSAVWKAELDSLRARGLVVTRPELYLSDEIESPVVYWCFGPVLLLPVSALSWPSARIAPVLLHEVAHLERGDLWKRVVAQLACVLYWPNPLVWLGTSRMQAFAEQACDDRVLGAGVSASAYAGLLLETTQRVRRAAIRPLALTDAIATMAGGVDFKERVLSLLDPALGRGPLGRRASLATICGVAVIVIVAGTVQPGAAVDGTSPSSTAARAGGPASVAYDGPEIVPGLAEVFPSISNDLDQARLDFVARADNVIVSGVGYLVYARHEDRIDDLLSEIGPAMRRHESVGTANRYIDAIIQEHMDIGLDTLRMLPASSARQDLQESLITMYREMEEVAARHLRVLARSDGSPELVTAATAVIRNLENWTRWAQLVTAKA